MGRNNNNKKRGKGTKNKKNKGRGPIIGRSDQQQQPNGGGSSNHGNLFRILRDLPTFHNHHNDDPKKVEESNGHEVGDSSSGTVGGYYGIYKQSTTNFWVWMKLVLPNSKIVSVNDLRRGADLILQNNIASIEKRKITSSSSSEDFPPAPINIPYAIIKELSTSIKYREMLTETKFGGGEEASGSGGGDEGHRFMIDVLKYCRLVLRFGRNVAKIAAMDDSNKKKKVPNYDELDMNIGGRFNALIVDDQEDEEDNEDDEDFKAIENNMRQRVYPTFKPPKEPDEDIDIEQVLINGDDRLQAIALLHTMNDMMGVVHAHYELLKNCLRGKTLLYDSDNSIQLLMECAVASNMATESVRVAENELYANHPHIQSFYHVLALVVFPSLLANIKNKIEEARKKADCEPNAAALKFVGDIIECSFHVCGEEKIPGKVKWFAKKLGIKQSYLEKQAKMVYLATWHETQLAMEEPMNISLNEAFKTKGRLPHSWLSKSKYIGGDRCILNTQNIVQKIMGITKNSTKLVGKPGVWGPSFDEKNEPVVRIRGCLDEVFAANILPELIAKCIQAPFHKLPESSQLLTVIDLLQQHVKGDRNSPVPIALSFGLHAILTSILVLQGDGDLASLAARAKGSYNELFLQLNAISDQSVSPANVPMFYSNVGKFKNIILFAKPSMAKYDSEQVFLDPEVAEKFAFWNPIIGGEYLLYGTYFCSIGLGSTTIDLMGQLRFTLHLYNALKQYKQQQGNPSSSSPPPMEVPIIQDIDNMFARTKAVWVGGRPQFGSFCKNFWMSLGMSIASATQMASASSENNNDSSSKAFMMNSIRKSRKDGPEFRHLDGVYPEEYSASYKCLVQRVFNDGNANYSVLNTTKERRNQHRLFVHLLAQVNMTRVSMYDDKYLLPMNLSVVGCILLEFTNLLSKHIGWEDIIDQAIKSYPEEMREGKTMGRRKMKPGNFNTSDLNLKRQGMAHMWGGFLSLLDKAGSEKTGSVVVPSADEAAEFMEKFFRDIPRERYTFFVEKKEEETKKTSEEELSIPSITLNE